MKTYTIINTDIMLNGKVFPEGSTIELDDNEAESLSDFLVPTKLEPYHKPLVLNSNQDQLKLKKRSK